MLVSFWKHHPIADQNGRLLAEQTILFQRKFNFDYIKITPAGSWLAVCYGLKDAFEGDALGRREIGRPHILSPQDWHYLADFRTSIPRMLNEQLQTAYLTRKAFPDQPVYVTVFSPISQAIQLAGLDQFIRHWCDCPDDLAIGLERLAHNLCFVLEEFRRQSIQDVYYVIQHARQGGLPPHIYRQVSELTDHRCVHKAAQLFHDVVIHLHGQEVYSPCYFNVPNVRFHYGTTMNSGWFPIGITSHASCLPGLPTGLLASCQDVDTASQLLANYYTPYVETDQLHLMSECVLPLAFSEHQINVWTQAARCFNPILL